jgi:hypothetical protein
MLSVIVVGIRPLLCIADAAQQQEDNGVMWVEWTTARLWSLGKEISRAKPARLRELIGQMVARIDLYFGSVKKRTRTEHPFQRGEIRLRPDPSLVVCNSVSRGDWIRTSDLLTPGLCYGGFRQMYRV